MQLSGMINVALGLVLVYLVLSLIGTTVNELISIVVHKRGHDLRVAIAKLIDNKEILDRFYQHGLIASGAEAGSGNKPTADLPPYIDGRDFATVLLESLDKANKVIDNIDVATQRINALPGGKLKDVLFSGLTKSGGDIVRLRAEITAWFDTSMDNLSGLFRRQMKVISLVTGILIAGLVNADSINIARAIWNDPSLQQQLVQAGERMLAPDSVANVTCETANTDLDCRLQQLKHLERELRPLPLGWVETPLMWQDWTIVLSKLLGILWTGIAISLGAPFWFDVLKRFMSVRGATKPEES